MSRYVLFSCIAPLICASLAPAADRPYHFENDIEPILSRFGCNSSGCHGKAEGQNGFKLSIFASDPKADFNALVRESRGRRIVANAPEQSLLLRKAAGQVAHGGGVRIQVTSEEYQTLRAWVAAGAPFGAASAPRLVSLRVEPHEHVLAMHGGQQLRALACYSDGREIDVTRHARFQSNNDGLATVSPTGMVTAFDTPGDVAIMAAYLGDVDVFRALIPRPRLTAKARMPLPVVNFIDACVEQKLSKLNIELSGGCDDAEFLRRAYLDIIGTLPTPTEARQFLADKSLQRRASLVNALLQRSEFADYWALKWADLLRVDRQSLGHQRAYAFYRWIRDSFAANKPLDQFARELLTATGPIRESGPANFYAVVGKPGEMASTVAQVFLGVRIACAECHHHPFDRWSQHDYYGMQGFFTPVRVQGDALIAADAPPTRHPRTGEVVFTHALGAATPKDDLPGDRRIAFADWLTAADNPYFARNLANRVWAHFLGRGLVEPVDDVRATNPATNPELLNALAEYLVDRRFDIRQLIRAITASRTYQSCAQPNPTNEKDEQNYSRALLKRIDAEVMLDMVCQATGVPEQFRGAPRGTRGIQLWDSKAPHYFLKQFGRPQRVSACECERHDEPNITQVLHLLNSPEIQAKLNHEAGAVARLVRQTRDNDVLVDELYLTFFSRFPLPTERRNAVDYLRKHEAARRAAAEDLAWGLLNSLEFRFNH